MGSLGINDLYARYLKGATYGHETANTAGWTNSSTLEISLDGTVQQKTAPETASPNMDWLDERVNEMRVKL